ncbi:hypothetical protein BDP81DRAFT_456120 [Colletotrichum phormii]|uniref:F-box domain-containing protein n=1 Tax=Colletotrichum phormii TaxID=359342 RepID=A0AAI9ZBK9_9PEZI|nr:uncharacterized protein BDP81DRAFT_456120 [Colletotrichum phormii]KAK1621518.1 hypothetical protein BDP81DRAFT_456120 [Colletotrichum phormii]
MISDGPPLATFLSQLRAIPTLAQVVEYSNVLTPVYSQIAASKYQGARPPISTTSPSGSRTSFLFHLPPSSAHVTITFGTYAETRSLTAFLQSSGIIARTWRDPLRSRPFETHLTKEDTEISITLPSVAESNQAVSMDAQPKSSHDAEMVQMPMQAFHRFPALPTEIQRFIIKAVASKHYSPPISDPIQSTCPNLRPKGGRRREAQATLANACLVSKHLKALAQPLLYRHFCLSISWPSKNLKFCSKDFLALANFVATINDKPILANMVREVEIIENRISESVDDSSAFGPIPTDLKARLHEVEADGHKFDSTRFIKDMGPAALCALIQILVLKARKIELLKLVLLNETDTVVWRPLLEHIIWVREQAHGRAWNLPNLEGFRIKHSDDDNDDHWEHKDGMSLSNPIVAKELMIPLSSPNLEEFCFDRCDAVDSQLPVLKKLRYLGAQNVFLKYKELESILKMSSNLEIFSYYSASLVDTWRERNVYNFQESEAWGTEACPYEVTPREMSILLLRHKKTLRTIHIFRRSFELDEEPTILSLTRFKELKYLLLWGNGLLNPYSPTYYPSGVYRHSVLQPILPEKIVSVTSNDFKYFDILNLSAELENGEQPCLRNLWIPNWPDMELSAAEERYADPILPFGHALVARNIRCGPIQSQASAASRFKSCTPGKQDDNSNSVYCCPGDGLPLLDQLFSNIGEDYAG